MKTNKLGFLGLLTIIAFNYASMEKTPLQIIKQDTSRSIASEIAVTSTTEVAQDKYKPKFIGLSTIIKEESDLKAASNECSAFLSDVLERETTAISSNSCYFQTSVCSTDTVKLYKIDLRKVEKEDANNRPLAKKKITENTKKEILSQLTTQLADHKSKYCEVKKEEVAAEPKKEELLPASKTDAVETANGQIPNKTTGKASTEVAKASDDMYAMPEHDNFKDECSYIRKTVKADKRTSSRTKATTRISAASRYANRDSKRSETTRTRQAETPDYEMTEILLEDAEDILNDEEITKGELKFCLRKFKYSKNSTLSTLAKDFKIAQDAKEKIAKEVENSLKNYDERAEFILQQQTACSNQAQQILQRTTQQQPTMMNTQNNPYAVQNQQIIQQVNQGALQAYQAKMNECKTYNTNTLMSQYSNGLSGYLNNSSRYVQSKVKTPNVVSSYQEWVKSEISAMQNALGYNTFSDPSSFIAGNTQKTFTPSSTSISINNPAPSSVANPLTVQNTVPGTRTMTPSYAVTGSYSGITPSVATPNFAPTANNTANGQIRRPSQLVRR